MAGGWGLKNPTEDEALAFVARLLKAGASADTISWLSKSPSEGGAKDDYIKCIARETFRVRSEDRVKRSRLPQNKKG